MAALWMTACTSETDEPSRGKGILQLSLVRATTPGLSTRAVDNDLAVELYDPEGTLVHSFAPGTVPGKIEVESGVRYTLRAYTVNQDTWQEANDGLGEACYYGETTTMVAENETVYCIYRVPMSNYAVQFALPEYFHNLFPTYTFTLTSGERQFTLPEGQKAYFSADNGFSYLLQATNVDNVTHSQEVQTQQEVKAGRLYSIVYSYGDDTHVEESKNTEP